MDATLFAHAHASHPDWRMALGLATAQLEAQLGAGPPPTIGWCYLTDHHAAAAEALLAALRDRFPATAWVGAVGVGICASGVEYYDEPALALMLGHLPREQFRLFSGRKPLTTHDAATGFVPHTALVHADPATADLSGLIGELADRVTGRYLFGGLASSRTRSLTLADGVYEGGLSGVAFSAAAGVVSRVTQGCQPLGPARRIGEVERNVVYTLDGEPALDVLLSELGVSDQDPRAALTQLRGTLVGLSDAEEAAPFGLPAQNPEFATPARRGAFGTETRVRHLVGIDSKRRGLAIADTAESGLFGLELMVRFRPGEKVRPWLGLAGTYQAVTWDHYFVTSGGFALMPTAGLDVATGRWGWVRLGLAYSSFQASLSTEWDGQGVPPPQGLDGQSFRQQSFWVTLGWVLDLGPSR